MNEDEDLLPDPPQRASPQAVTRVPKGFHDIKSIYSAVRAIRKSEYKHKPLSPGQGRIRLLYLYAGKPDDTIHCSFKEITLKNARGRYEALSYYWGTDEPSGEIWIQDPTELKGARDLKALAASATPKRFYVRANLYAALRRFRERERHILLWVDALCIDQEDYVEKNQQVQMMSQIYNAAHHVLIWLGAGDPKCKEAVDFISKVVDLTAFDSLATDKMSASKWNAFMHLMRCRWFSRRWVVQELAFARDATLHYDDETINWKDFADAVAALFTRYDDIKKLSWSSGYHKHDAEFEGLGAYILVDVTNNLFRIPKILEGRPLDTIPGLTKDTGRYPLLSLEALVAMLLSFEASDPRDTIYALLSIAKYKSDKLKPDYKKTIIEVYRDFIRYCVETSGSIDIICRHWAPIEKPPSATLQPVRLSSKKKSENPKLNAKMPSWVALLTKSRYGDPEQALNGRVNGDSLVGHPDHKFYNACGRNAAKVDFENIDLEINRTKPPEAGDSTSPSAAVNQSTPSTTDQRFQPNNRPVNAFFMFAKGFQVDTIQKVSARIADGLLLRECLTMGGWGEPYPLKTNRNVPDELLRTLVAGKDPKGGNPPRWYHRACLQCFSCSTPSGDINTSSLIANPETPSLVVKFLKRVQSVVWERVFLKSKQQGFFGLGPNEARDGDLICILYGCSVPVILREIRDLASHEILHYELIGESYIYGLMDGEATESLPATRTTTFKLG